MMRNCDCSTYLRIQIGTGVSKERIDAAKHNLIKSGLYFLKIVRKGKGRQNGSG